MKLDRSRLTPMPISNQFATLELIFASQSFRRVVPRGGHGGRKLRSAAEELKKGIQPDIPGTRRSLGGTASAPTGGADAMPEAASRLAVPATTAEWLLHKTE